MNSNWIIVFVNGIITQYGVSIVIHSYIIVTKRNMLHSQPMDIVITITH